ncbi:actin maturation protease isoform X4 [Canis lupus baileyi]|uniref:actin maturation protease isoform X4 n=1 Tax=Canis lupus baileyi TaxID=143281 RepID=UPI003B970CD1
MCAAAAILVEGEAGFIFRLACGSQRCRGCQRPPVSVPSPTQRTFPFALIPVPSPRLSHSPCRVFFDLLSADSKVRAGGSMDGRHAPGTTQWHPAGETCAGGHGERLHGPGRDVLRTSYDEDFNHEPCQRKGHKAHWAVSAGVLLGVQAVPSPGYAEDPELPGLFHPAPSTLHQPPSLPEDGSSGAVYLLSKQGKSWHYQLWDYDQVRDSNLQLTDFSPSRATDGRAYVVPAGGVQAGLCGQALLLTPQDFSR